MVREARWVMWAAVAATGIAMLVATVTRDAWLFLIAAGGAASAAVIWGPKAPLD